MRGAVAALAIASMFAFAAPALAVEPSPDAEAGIGTPLSIARGVATYCAPTPTKCQGWGGGAMLGAVQSFTDGDKPYSATVCLNGTRPCVTVTVVSYCACGDRPGGPTVIDLSPAAFRGLAPLSRGVIPVTLETGGPIVLPATDTAPPPPAPDLDTHGFLLLIFALILGSASWTAGYEVGRRDRDR